MTLEEKKKKLELARVRLAREELEFRIEQHLHDIELLKKNIELQKTHEDKLKQELGE